MRPPSLMRPTLAGFGESAHWRPVDHYANAIRAVPGQCWRIVSRGPGYRMGSPTDCREPVRRTPDAGRRTPDAGRRAMVGRKRMRLSSCEGHVDGLEDVRPDGGNLSGRMGPVPSAP